MRFVDRDSGGFLKEQRWGSGESVKFWCMNLPAGAGQEWTLRKVADTSTRTVAARPNPLNYVAVTVEKSNGRLARTAHSCVFQVSPNPQSHLWVDGEKAVPTAATATNITVSPGPIAGPRFVGRDHPQFVHITRKLSNHDGC